jgi:hypothetical protein
MVAVAVTKRSYRPQFSDKNELIEIEATGKQHKVNPIGRDPQWPLRVSDYIGSHEYSRTVLMSRIKAKLSAIDLADGIGLLGPEPYTGFDSNDEEPWSGSPVHPKEDRRRPVLWEDDVLITFDQPHDGYAAYGRPSIEYVARQRDAAVGCAWLFPVWFQHEHLGEVPDGPPVDTTGFAPPLVSGASRLRPTSAAQTCVPSELQTVARWIMDTGCGTDLISKEDATRCAPDTFHQGKSVAFNTAGGPARTRLKAQLHVAELEQTATARFTNEMLVIFSGFGPEER